MNNYETSNIIHLLPRELQIHCLQFLITPNERILVVGSKKVGKTSFINRFIIKCMNICDINRGIIIRRMRIEAVFFFSHYIHL